MSVVSNSSALINMARIGRLDLLRQLYGELLIPQAVWDEVVIEGAGQPGANEVKEASWIKKCSVNDEQLVRALRQELGAGEAEAIVLALEVEAEILLMDERLGRETAHYMGLRRVGLIGALIEAKHRGLIDAIKPLLDVLRTQAGFRVSDDLYTRVLEDEGET